MKPILVCGFTLAIVASGVSRAASVILTNPGFADGTNPNATGWERVDGQGTNNSPSNYAEAMPGLPSRTMQIKSDGANYVQQTISLTDLGAMDATTFPGFVVGFDYGYRRDGAVNGDHTLRVSLWNVTTNLELAGSDLLIANPGIGANSLTLATFNLPYDNTAVTAGNEIAIRFTSISPDLGGSAWQRTAMIDNVALTAIPEPGAAALGGLGLLLLLRRSRRLG